MFTGTRNTMMITRKVWTVAGLLSRNIPPPGRTHSPGQTAGLAVQPLTSLVHRRQRSLRSRPE